MKTSRLRFPLFVLLAFALSCSSSPEKKDGSLTEESGPIPKYLELIPESTPFVFGALDPVPEPVALEQFAALDSLLGKSLEGLPDDAELSYMTAEERFSVELARAFRGKLNEQGLAELGLSSSPRFVVYGIGPFPVFRLEIEDGQKLVGLVDRIAKESGLLLAVQTEQEVEYRTYVSGTLQVSFAVIGNEAVFTVTDVDAAPIVVPYALGVKKPEQSLADDNPLAKAAKQYGLVRHGVGFVNVMEVAAMFTQGGSALNAAAFSVMDQSSEPVTAACQQEVAEYAAAMPRIVGGLEALNIESMTVKVAAEFTNDVPSRLQAARRPIPGWSAFPISVDSEAPISVGIGAHVGTLLDLAREKLRQNRDRAFACEQLQGFPQMSSEGLAYTQFVPPVVSDLTGARMAFEGIRTPQNNDSPSQPTMLPNRLIDAWAVLRTPDPQTFLTSLRTFAPPAIQNLQIKPDGEPVAIPIPEDDNAPFESLKLVMTKQSLGIATTDTLLPRVKQSVDSSSEKANSAESAQTPMIAVAFDMSRVMSAMMGPLADPNATKSDTPFFVTVDPTDDAIVTTVRVPLASLLSGAML